jgi:hypothetical protein
MTHALDGVDLSYTDLGSGDPVRTRPSGAKFPASSPAGTA